MKVYSNTDKTLDEIKALEKVGVVMDECRSRQIDIYQDPEDPEYVYTLGHPWTLGTVEECVITDRNKISENRSFAIAIDYQIHGRGAYTAK